MIRRLVRRIPILRSIVRVVYRRWIKLIKPFAGSESYWIQRYNSGGHSGRGSFGKLAAFKAKTVNEFVRQHGIETVIEYGCGDGRQLKLADYPSYVGFDVSSKAVSLCKEAFIDDGSKTFKMMSEYTGETAELTVSLDVIYHLIEDEVFADYMHRLFDSSSRFVMIYSSDTDVNPDGQDPHIKHRSFTAWVADLKPEWRLLRRVPNEYPYDDETRTGSRADFFIYERV